MKRVFAWLCSACCVACANPLPPPTGEGDSTTTDVSTTVAASSDGPGTSSSGASATSLDPDATETSTTTGPPVDCTEDDGQLGDGCPDNAPFCVDGVCVGCTNPAAAGCEEVNAPGGDVCDASGACVLCTAEDASACGGETPICDVEVNACVACTAHEQCAPSACNLFEGSCVGGDVLNAGPMQPYTTLNLAVAALGGEGTIIVHPGTYNEAVELVGSDVVVAFLAAPGTPPDWQRTSGAGDPQLRANAGATVLVEGILFRLNSTAAVPALLVDDGGRLWMDRSTIGQNAGQSLSAEVNAQVMLRNSFLGGAVDLAVLNADGTSTVAIEYSSLGAGVGSAIAVLCDGGSQVTVSDSIVLSRGDAPVSCPMFIAERTAANGVVLPGTNNVDIGAAVMTAWFTGYNAGDFHLTESGQGVFMNIAEWNDGDPLVDIDGDERSGVEGTLEHAGADFIP